MRIAFTHHWGPFKVIPWKALHPEHGWFDGKILFFSIGTRLFRTGLFYSFRDDGKFWLTYCTLDPNLIEFVP